MAWPLSESHCTVQPRVKISLYTMLSQIQYFICIIFLVQVRFCQRIQLFPYNETKNCNISLVEENDIILMYGKVDFKGNIPASSVVNFEIKRTTDTSFHFIYFVKIPEDCDKDFHNCNCFKTDDQKFILSLNMNAHKVTSEADIRAELVYMETTFYSEIIKLPIVYDSRTDKVAVYVDNKVVHFQQNEVSINDTQCTIVSICREMFAQDCNLQLTDLETGTLLKSGKVIVVYNTNIKGRSNFDLNYSICNIERNISFSITNNRSTSNFHSMKTRDPEVIILSAIHILILAMMSSYVFFLRCNRYIHEDDNEEESQYLINETTRHRNRELNEKSQHGNSRKSDNQQKKKTSITDVPIRYREKDFQKLLGVLSQLTCRITLKRMSFSTHSKEVGCGLVTSVLKYVCGVGIETVKRSQSRVCPCPKCLKSKSPSNTWAEIFITTSSSILKNTYYHKQIMCVLCTADNVTTELRELTVEHIDAWKSGRCVFKYVTCDQSLINNLQVLQEERSRLEEKVQEIFHQDRHHDQIYLAFVFRENGTKYLRTGVWSYGKTKHNVRTYHYDPEIPFTNTGAPVVLLGYSHEENEYNYTQNPTSADLSYNISSSYFKIVFSQKVKIN